jgi:protein dithiol oxidoreductase (disulfide-forming)
MTQYNRRAVLTMGAALAFNTGKAFSAERWIEGKHYFRLEKPLPSAHAGAATVSEIFSYGCSACNRFLPYMQALEKKLGPAIAVEYLHASWLPAENWHTLQRAHISASTLGIARKAHDAMFAAVWQTGELAIVDARTGRLKSRLPSIQDIAGLYQRVAGMPVARFLETSRSFSVDSGIRSTDALITRLGADSTPTIIVNGKFRLEPRSAGGAQQAVDLALFLRDK